jgi:WD40 repeat protein
MFLRRRHVLPILLPIPELMNDNVRPVQIITGRWTFHSARIYALSWTSDGAHIASASLDTHVYIWSVAKPLKNIALKNVGPGGLNTVEWVGPNKLATAGADGCVRVFSILFH